MLNAHSMWARNAQNRWTFLVPKDGNLYMNGKRIRDDTPVYDSSVVLQEINETATAKHREWLVRQAHSTGSFNVACVYNDRIYLFLQCDRWTDGTSIRHIRFDDGARDCVSVESLLKLLQNPDVCTVGGPPPLVAQHSESSVLGSDEETEEEETLPFAKRTHLVSIDCT